MQDPALLSVMKGPKAEIRLLPSSALEYRVESGELLCAHRTSRPEDNDNHKQAKDPDVSHVTHDVAWCVVSFSVRTCNVSDILRASQARLSTKQPSMVCFSASVLHAAMLACGASYITPDRSRALPYTASDRPSSWYVRSPLGPKKREVPQDPDHLSQGCSKPPPPSSVPADRLVTMPQMDQGHRDHQAAKQCRLR